MNKQSLLVGVLVIAGISSLWLQSSEATTDPAMNYQVKLQNGDVVLCDRARTDNGGTLFVQTKDGRRLAFSPMSWHSFETVAAR